MSAASPPVVRFSLAVVGAFAGVYLIWGTTYLAIALSIKSIPPFISGAARFLLAGALMYAWLRLRNPKPFAGLNIGLAAVCGVLLVGVGNGFVIWGQQGIPSGVAALIVASVPVTVLVFDWAFFSQRAPTVQALLGTTIAVAGVATIVVHTRTLSGDADPIYVLSVFGAVVCWAIGSLVQRRSARPDTVFSLTCAQMLFGALFQVVMSFVDGEWARFDPAAVSLESVLALLYLVVFGSIVALNCYLWLLTRVPAQKVTTYALVNPVVALVLGAVVLDEPITALAVAAAALVLLGVGLVLFQDATPWRLWRARRAAAKAQKIACCTEHTG